MITVDHDLPPTPRISQMSHFKLWPFYKDFSKPNAKSPLFAGATRNLTLVPSKMLRALVPIYRADEVIE